MTAKRRVRWLGLNASDAQVEQFRQQVDTIDKTAASEDYELRMEERYLDRLLDGMQVDRDAPGIRYGNGVAIYADKPTGPVWGHGGWIPGYVSSLRYYADHGVTFAFQINTDVGIVDDRTDFVPAIETALADLSIGASNGWGPQP